MSDDWLHERHAAYGTPIERIRTVVQRTTGQEGVSFERIVRGHANEVYRVRTLHDQALIVRINQHGSVGFHEEAWAMEQCRAAGVPVPKVHGVETLTTSPLRKIMVLEHAAGRPLNEKEGSLTDAQRREVWINVGAVLGAIHSIHVDGFSLMREAGRWDFPDWQRMIHTALEERRADVPDLLTAGLTQDEVDGLLAIVAYLSTLDVAQPVLCHGDLATEHIFVDDSLQVSALIDFGLFQGAPPALDFAMLHMYHPDVALSWIMEGYPHQHAMDSSFRAQVIAHVVNVGTSFLADNMRVGNAAIADVAVPGLRAALAEWNEL